jgi:site-specific DNA-cytosine methylase
LRFIRGGQNSVYEALKNNKDYKVYTFDITKPTREHHYDHDLSEPIKDLIKYFDKFPKPDVIVASPLCQSFSSIKSMKGGGTAC